MKKALFSFALVLLLSATAFAADFDAKGSAIVPNINGSSYSSTSYVNTSLTITNITGTDVKCRVTIIDHDGRDVSAWGKVLTGGDTAGLKVLATHTNTFDIPANSTRVYWIKESKSVRFIGYGVIEWTSTEPMHRKALIAGMYSMSRSGDEKYAYGFPVNDGQPF